MRSRFPMILPLVLLLFAGFALPGVAQSGEEPQTQTQPQTAPHGTPGPVDPNAPLPPDHPPMDPASRAPASEAQTTPPEAEPKRGALPKGAAITGVLLGLWVATVVLWLLARARRRASVFPARAADCSDEALLALIKRLHHGDPSLHLTDRDRERLQAYYVDILARRRARRKHPELFRASVHDSEETG